MKIGIDIRTLMDPLVSGVPEYTTNLLKELFRLDKKNDYVLFYNGWKDRDGQMPKFVGKNIQTVVSRYPNKIFNNIMQLVLSRPKLDQLTGTDLFFMPNISFAALSARCRKIITIHDLSWLRYPNFFSFKRRAWHRLINVRRFLSQFDQVVAVSEHTKRDIVSLCGYPEERIRVIYHGVGAEFRLLPDSDPRLAEIKRRYQLPDKFILYLGTLEPRKNVDGLVRAFELLQSNYPRLKDYNLIIAGAKGWKYQNIFRAINRSPARLAIKYIGYAAAEDKPYIYNLASLFVYPSFYEGFGFPPLEAMATGRPTIVSAAASLPEAVGPGALMVDPNNVMEISQAMAEVLLDSSLLKFYAYQGREHAKKFSWEKAARSYLQLFIN